MRLKKINFPRTFIKKIVSMEDFQPVISKINSILDYQLIHLGDSIITLKSTLVLLISLFLLFYLSARFKHLLVRRIFPRYQIESGAGQSIAAIVRYFILIIGLFIILQSTGINLSTLGLLVGALGVGIGFGLQNITNNFISGIIILFERPIKVGDRIEVDDIAGNIVNISARATSVLTNDNIAIIIPNAEFINSKVINWSHNDRNVRLNFPVGVSYKENPDQIRQVLIEVAKSHPGVLSTPSPNVLFDQFGESSLDFVLQVWTTEYTDKPRILKSELYFSIFRKFRELGIEIPFPQRDLHLISGFDTIKAG
jgi:small-conductance mechanosensitive channel